MVAPEHAYPETRLIAAPKRPATSGARRGRSVLRGMRLLFAVFLWAAIGAVGGVALATVAPPIGGYKVLTVFTGSMVPTLEVGSVVIDEPIKPKELRVGDIVTFPDPDDNARQLTHRVQSMRIGEARTFVVTKGDANDAVERWNVLNRDELGRVVYTLPKVGHVRQWIAGRTARFALLGMFVLIGLSVLWEVWRPTKRQPEDTSDHETV